ncbi:MAG: hypothetical protein LBE84_06880 [Planctomycetota bacterium]|jgi:hypothetical protein|nr:hypothetical protein [Planctomycetota bacterium]
MGRAGYPVVVAIVLAVAGGNAGDMLFLKGDGVGDKTRVNRFEPASRPESPPAGEGVSASAAPYFKWRNQCAVPAGRTAGFAFIAPYVESGFPGMNGSGRPGTMPAPIASFTEDSDLAAFFGGFDPPPEQSH